MIIMIIKKQLIVVLQKSLPSTSTVMFVPNRVQVNHLFILLLLLLYVTPASWIGSYEYMPGLRWNLHSGMGGHFYWYANTVKTKKEGTDS